MKNRKILAGFIFLSALNSYAATNSSITKSYLTVNNFPTTVNLCQSKADFVEKATVINNHGVVSGSINSIDQNGICNEHAFLWGAANKPIEVIPLVTIPDKIVHATIISSISSDNQTVGINFVADSFSEYRMGAYNVIMNPSMALLSENYPQQISENGKFVTGFNFGGQIFIYDTESKHLMLDFKLKNSTLTNIQNATLVSIDNKGTAVGTINLSEAEVYPLICEYSSQSCQYIKTDAKHGACFLSTITTDGKEILGHCNSDGHTELIKFDQILQKIIPIPQTNDLHSPSGLTDDKIAVVSDLSKHSYLYNAKSGKVYSALDFAAKLDLPANINANKITLSPDGHNVLFDSRDFSTANYAVKVHLTMGVAEFINKNLTPLN